MAIAAAQRRAAATAAAAACSLLGLVGCSDPGRLIGPEQEKLFPKLSNGRISAPTPGSCTKALAPGQAANTYTHALQQLQQGAEISDIPHLGCLLPADRKQQSSAELYARMVSTVFLSEVLHDQLSSQLQQVIATDRQLGPKRDAGLAWHGAYLLEAAIEAYRHTGEQRYLELFRNSFDQILQRRDIHSGFIDVLRGRPTQGWSSINISEEKRSKNEGPPFLAAHVTHTARIVYPATEFARLVLSKPELKARYEATAQRYISASRAAMHDFDDDWGVVNGQTIPGTNRPLHWYRRPVTNSLEATNHIHIAANVWLNLARLTNEPQYLENTKDVLAIFRKGVVQEDNGTVHWNYFPFFATAEKQRFSNGRQWSEATWKASLTTPFLARAEQLGFPELKPLTQAIARSINQEILGISQIRRNLSSKYSRWIDGSDPKDSKQLGKLDNTTLFLSYAALEPQIAEKLVRLHATRPDLFPMGWLGSAPGALGYAQFLKPTSSSSTAR